MRCESLISLMVKFHYHQVTANAYLPSCTADSTGPLSRETLSSVCSSTTLPFLCLAPILIPFHGRSRRIIFHFRNYLSSHEVFVHTWYTKWKNKGGWGGCGGPVVYFGSYYNIVTGSNLTREQVPFRAFRVLEILERELGSPSQIRTGIYIIVRTKVNHSATTPTPPPLILSFCI